MNRDKREPDYPTELESQIIMRLPEEPAKHLRELLKTGDSLKNRLTIQIENDMRQGEVKLDNWMMHAKIVDLPTIVESLKTIDNKSFYKTADICQMMICKEEPDQPTVEEESPAKNKKKDPYKVEKKFLWPHGITPPTKNVRRRRFRKTLKKKYVEAPEIEKEVKRLLRADNEADSVTWEVIVEDDKQPTKMDAFAKNKPGKPEKKQKPERIPKRELKLDLAKPQSTSRVVDIFGEAVSDSDLEEDNTAKTKLNNSRMSAYNSSLSDASLLSFGETSKKYSLPEQFSSLMFEPTQGTSKSFMPQTDTPSTSGLKSSAILSSGEEGDNLSRDSYKENMNLRIEQARTELQELKQRRLRTQNEIAGMDNLALRQRFQETLHTLNQDIMYKEMEYQGMITLQNSEDI